MPNKPPTTTEVLDALSRMLNDHYGKSNGTHLANYATLWDTLLDSMAWNTIDREMLDEYLDDRNKGRTQA